MVLTPLDLACFANCRNLSVAFLQTEHSSERANKRVWSIDEGSDVKDTLRYGLSSGASGERYCHA